MDVSGYRKLLAGGWLHTRRSGIGFWGFANVTWAFVEQRTLRTASKEVVINIIRKVLSHYFLLNHITVHFAPVLYTVCLFHIADGWRRFAFLTRWSSVPLQVLLSATPQGGTFPEVSHPQALLGSLVSIPWKFQFTKIVSEFVINF